MSLGKVPEKGGEESPPTQKLPWEKGEPEQTGLTAQR